jgi:hypothetical protein
MPAPLLQLYATRLHLTMNSSLFSSLFLQTLWRNVLIAEINVAMRTTTDWQWRRLLREKVVALAALYRHLPHMVPLAFVVRELERLNGESCLVVVFLL